MKVLFVGDTRLFDAVKRLSDRCNLQIEWEHQEGVWEEKSSGLHAIVLDSKWFRSFREKQQEDPHCKIIVIGPYTDSMSRQAFTPNKDCIYIAYSELEHDMVPVLEKFVKTALKGGEFLQLPTG